MRTELDKGAASFHLWVYVREIIDILSWKVVPAFVLMLLISLTEGVSLMMLAPLLQLTGFDLGSGPVGQVAGVVAQAFGVLGLPLSLFSVLCVYVATITTKALLGRFEAISNFALQQVLIVRFRQRLYRALVQANWLFFVRSRSSDFMHKLTHELDNVGAATFNLLQWLVRLVVTLTYLAFALFLSPFMTLLVLASGAALALLLRLKTRLARGRGEVLSRSYENMYAAISDQLSGMKTAKSHGVEDRYVELFLQTTREVERAQIGVVENSETVNFWFQVGSTTILAVIIFVALEVLTLSVANILLLLYLFSRLIPMLSSVQSGYQSFLTYIPAYENIKKLERECLEAAELPGESAHTLTLHRELELEGVSFSYRTDSSKVTIETLNLTVEAGKTTAIVGPSGAGKSTIADFVVGLLTPSQGKVLIDGVPLGAANLRGWRQGIGYVAQDTFIFHDTVRANLLLTKPDATDQELFRALRSAAAADFVNALAMGLDTVLGDRGVRLSGGERQRLALARALLRCPTLLVLDEATSSLDVENEKHIQHAIEELHGRMTILIIAHRLSTIRNADVIYVLERGRVVEVGNWKTLVGKPYGRFQALCEAQGLVAAQPVATL